MAKPILFVLHGMGKHKSDWHKEITASLDLAVKSYPLLKDEKLSNFAKIERINYDDIFEEQRKRWTEDASKVIRKMTEKKDDKHSRVLGDFEADKLYELQDGPAEDYFFNTLVLDILFYRYTFLGEVARIRVAKNIVSTLESQIGAVTPWYVRRRLGFMALQPGS